LGSEIHRLALVEGRVGRGTRVWPWAHVCRGAVVGNDCNICEHVYIEKGAKVGNRVTIKSHVSVWEGVTIEDDAFIGPGVCFTNDPWPRSKQYITPHTTLVKKGASIGAGAVVLCDVTIGEGAMVGAGAIVTGDLADHATFIMQPKARIYIRSPPA
jgi:acetyltransferase-like isoleucine patch superfamily enzyme